MVFVFWLAGYGVFFRYVVGRVMFGFVARDFLTRNSHRRPNPLRVVSLFCPSSVVADFTYLEGFLFSVEFLILTWLVVKFFSPTVQTKVDNPPFNLVAETNHNPAKQLELVQSSANVLRLFYRTRTKLYFSNSSFEMNLLSLKVLEHVFQPYNQQTWLVQVFKSFSPLLQEAAQQELANASLVH